MSQPTPPKNQTPDQTPTDPSTQKAQADEIGGPKGLEPTRYGDWERKGRCVDF